MSEQHANLDQRMKTWDGFLKLMTYSGAAVVIVLLLMWWTIV
ncbi:MAG: aa3-type cytochrome c oxidase subunit IV [Alphaproteobacteria bacterium]|jgi:hypothetical protein